MLNKLQLDSLINGGVGVLPTDTVYGLVASAFNPEAVERIYELRKRDADKPCIILISSQEELVQFGVELSLIKNAAKYWPSQTSIVLPVDAEKHQYLRPMNGTLAFRVPAKESLRELLSTTGALVAPSANMQGHEAGKNIEEIRQIFKEDVDFYIDGGVIDAKPSSIIKIYLNGNTTTLRE